jgi:5-methylcytosine-specific restriction endonuclease McrA
MPIGYQGIQLALLKTCHGCDQDFPMESFALVRPKRYPRSMKRVAYCKACRRARAAKYYDPDKAREYYLAHAARIKAASRKRHRERREERLAYFRDYRLANPERMQEHNAIQWARRRGVPLDEAGVEYREILRRDPCVFCGGPANSIDHIDPVVRGGTSEWMNLTSACQGCNAQKNARPLLIFLAERSADRLAS